MRMLGAIDALAGVLGADTSHQSMSDLMHCAETRPHVEGATTAVALHLDPCTGAVMTTDECVKAHATYLEVWAPDNSPPSHAAPASSLVSTAASCACAGRRLVLNCC